MTITVRAPRGFAGKVSPPPDKSITHRALLIGGIASGESQIRSPLGGGDCLSTARCLRSLGVEIRETSDGYLVGGVGLQRLTEPHDVLDAGNSGTTMRLLAGVLAGLPLHAVITGDASLRARPMERVVKPLRLMGAGIHGRDDGRLAPLSFVPGDGRLDPLDYELPVASAQVKSALLLAGIRCRGRLTLRGKTRSRDHTERIFVHLGVGLEQEPGRISLSGVPEIPSFSVTIPGDASSACFFLAGAALGRTRVTVVDCGINPTRLGFVEVLRRMGPQITVEQTREECGEPVGDIGLRSHGLAGVDVGPEEVPDLIDELPLLALIATQAEGSTVVHGAEDLRSKESDRIDSTARMIRALGGEIHTEPDGFRIDGPQTLRGGRVDSRGDHRIAMTAAVGAACGVAVTVDGFECSTISYPDFAKDLRRLGAEVEGERA